MMAVCCKDVTSTWEYYSKQFISGRDINAHGEDCHFKCFTQIFNGKLKNKNLFSFSLLFKDMLFHFSTSQHKKPRGRK